MIDVPMLMFTMYSFPASQVSLRLKAYSEASPLTVYLTVSVRPTFDCGIRKR